MMATAEEQRHADVDAEIQETLVLHNESVNKTTQVQQEKSSDFIKKCSAVWCPLGLLGYGLDQLPRGEEASQWSSENLVLVEREQLWLIVNNGKSTAFGSFLCGFTMGNRDMSPVLIGGSMTTGARCFKPQVVNNQANQ